MTRVYFSAGFSAIAAIALILQVEPAISFVAGFVAFMQAAIAYGEYRGWLY